MSSRIALIGAGNMAQALLGGLIRRGHPPAQLTAADPDPDCRTRVADRFGIECHADNAAAVKDAALVILAVKPQVIDTVVLSLQGALPADCVVASIAAGTPLARLGKGLSGGQPVARVMPNTPALLGSGASGLFCAPDCTDAQRALLREVFASVGEVVEVEDETLMEVVTAVSGSGPAYFFAFAEALTEAAVRAGLPPDAAEKLAAQTALGAGRMLAESDESAAELRQRVTSPGGTTAAALEVFSRGGLDALVGEAVDAAVARGHALGKL